MAHGGIPGYGRLAQDKRELLVVMQALSWENQARIALALWPGQVRSLLAAGAAIAGNKDLRRALLAVTRQQVLRVTWQKINPKLHSDIPKLRQVIMRTRSEHNAIDEMAYMVYASVSYTHLTLPTIYSV